MPLSPATNDSPSTTTLPSSTTVDEISIKSCLHQARMTLEHQDLCDHYNHSHVHHQTLTNELELICQENTDLKVTNSELVKLISLSSQASMMQQ
ncbi:hypothetical protein SADUNF_Sadunf07G0058300 [Salix dunnii]|uniref:Uncharacterized protein n=1 Tax=Salix dunnii TaxID=1413687 RepID=A0A835JZW5_9ROSI|nr:hypothetical protein SADUNF_Sadunf07G0058300 [Salix dunnii]